MEFYIQIEVLTQNNKKGPNKVTEHSEAEAVGSEFEATLVYMLSYLGLRKTMIANLDQVDTPGKRPSIEELPPSYWSVACLPNTFLINNG